MIDFNQIDEKIHSLGNKRYFSIREVSNFCDEKDSVLRYWESEFRQLKPQKVQNQRRYQQKDIQTILIIRALLRDEGMTIDQSREYLLNSKLVIKQQSKSNHQSLDKVNPKNLKDFHNELKTILISLN